MGWSEAEYSRQNAEFVMSLLTFISEINNKKNGK